MVTAASPGTRFARRTATARDTTPTCAACCLRPSRRRREIPARAVMADIKGVTARFPINRSLHTGVAAVDVLAPIGCGQCMLLVGEKGSGKSSLLIDAVNAAARKGVRSVYAAIGSGAPDNAVIGAPLLSPHRPCPTGITLHFPLPTVRAPACCADPARALPIQRRRSQRVAAPR